MRGWNQLLLKPAVWLGLGAVALGVTTFAVGRQSASQSTNRPTPLLGRYASEVSPSGNPMTSLRELDLAFAELVDQVSPSVVHIRAESNNRSAGGLRLGMPSAGQGSGVIYRSDGWIVTNDHVVNGFDKVTVILNDGREFEGKVTRANDPSIDIALVKIDAKDLPTARFGDSGAVRAGQFAIAIGSPFGFENSVTIGHISGLGRTNAIGDVQLGARTYTDLLQTDAPINPGNSGGPLMNINGEVVGINTSIYSGTGGNVGIGFAIPSNQARFLADLLMSGKKIKRGYLGVLPENLKEYERKKLGVSQGAIVREVPAEGPAAAAGIKPGDIITRVGDTPVRNQLDLRNAMLLHAPGSTVKVEVLRDKKPITVSVKVAEPPQTVAQAPRTRSGNPGEGLPPFEGMPNFPDLRDFGLVPPNVEPDVPPLREGKPRLGVTVSELTEAIRKEHGIPDSVQGVYVRSVESGSVASKAGLKPGDVVQKFDSVTVTTPEQLVQAIGKVKAGEKHRLEFSRYSNGSQMHLSLDVVF